MVLFLIRLCCNLLKGETFMQDFYVEKRTENGIEDGYVAVSVSQINLLAQFAVTLNVPENILAETEIGMYMVNLSEFYLKNDNELKDCYDKIKNDTFGSQFLYVNIKLALIQKLVKDTGLNDKLSSLYNKTLVDYKNQLEFNNYVYKEQLLKGMAM